MGELKLKLYITPLPSEVKMTITKPNAVLPASPAGAKHSERFTKDGKDPDYPYEIKPSENAGDFCYVGDVELASDAGSYGPQLEIPYEVERAVKDDSAVKDYSGVTRKGRILVETTWWSNNRPTHCLVSYEWQKERKTVEIHIPEEGAHSLDISTYLVVGYKPSEKRVGINGTEDKNVANELKKKAADMVSVAGAAGWLAVLI
ncbi:hypothetical protein V5O48_013611 [Marasmius crinis-equi]|uniref:Uncharacterized protein n=1 Tax=Marasmius crinis-equi TaxID=585013 RepID=A0ABR3F001_9AGAR